jgi:GNAT superfamily N-acetyltransferase
MKTGTHPEHNRIAQTVRGWFHLPFQSMGSVAERRRWGTYWNNARVYTSGFPPDKLEAFLVDLREYYHGQLSSIHLYIDDPGADAEMGPALQDAGWKAKAPELYLAHVGSVARPSEIQGLEIWPVHESNLCQFAATRLRAFSNSEEAADPYHIRDEISRRAQDLLGTGRGMLAKVHKEPAGIIWWHEETLDVWVKQLGTRIPFRRQGIARELLRQCIEDTYDRGFKSALARLSSNNVAARSLYHRLGFRDEVYWCRCYVLEKVVDNSGHTDPGRPVPE